MKLMIRYLKPLFGSVCIVLLIKMLATLVELFLPYIMSHILDNVVPRADLWQILWWGLLMILCALAAFWF
ncbi:MAG: ABC transporter ATP-binding protein, partial [Clostridia bacterium]|nr:ABC transporter ATP-binding protein [Clostridia bacterium]